MIIVPAMWPFPALEFEENIASLRLIALALMRLAAQNSDKPICSRLGSILADLEEECKDESDVYGDACEIFDTAMKAAIGDYLYAPSWATHHHNVTYDQTAFMRPAWAAHIARSIYEQIGA